MCSEFSWSGQLYGNSTSSGTRSIYKGRETMEVTYPRSRNGQSDVLAKETRSKDYIFSHIIRHVQMEVLSKKPACLTNIWSSLNRQLKKKSLIQSYKQIYARRFSLHEIKHGTQKFDDSNITGVGRFGNVYKEVIDYTFNIYTKKKVIDDKTKVVIKAKLNFGRGLLFKEELYWS